MENPQSIEAVGASVDDAVTRGLEALNLTRDSVTIQVLSDEAQDASKVRSREVRVRLTVKPRPMAITPTDQDESLAKGAAQTLQELLDKMHINGQVESRWDVHKVSGEKAELHLVLNIQGDDLGILIGRQGETSEALQYLTRLIVWREVERRFNLVIDIEGYKSRRERQLKQLAERMAERVVATRRPVALEPMPAYERRIVHIALRDHPTVTTESIGRGSSRKVTIIPRSGRRQ